MLFKLTWHTINWQVLVVKMEVASLDLLEHLVAKVANEAVIVFTLDMNDKLFVASLSALRQSHHLLQANVSLEDAILDIGDLMGRQEQVPGLFHAKSVVLKHLAGEDNVFYKQRHQTQHKSLETHSDDIGSFLESEKRLK